MKKITAKWLEKKGACGKGYNWFVAQKERETIKVLNALMKEPRLDWANWLIVRTMNYEQYVRYACYAAKQVLKNFEDKYPYDKRPRKAINAALKCLKNPTKTNKSAARSAYSAADSAARYTRQCIQRRQGRTYKNT